MPDSIKPGKAGKADSARSKRLGWDAWGNEVESDVELVA